MLLIAAEDKEQAPQKEGVIAAGATTCRKTLNNSLNDIAKHMRGLRLIGCITFALAYLSAEIECMHGLISYF